jgi:CRP-like cAMP-binding protein
LFWQKNCLPETPNPKGSTKLAPNTTVLALQVVTKIPFFHGADPAFVATTLINMHRRFYGTDDVVIQAGEIGRELFILSSGEVQVIVAGNVVATLPAVTYFGEIALLQNQRRMATIRATSFSNVLILTRDEFDRICKNFPELGKEIHKAAEQRAIDSLKQVKASQKQDDLVVKAAAVFMQQVQGEQRFSGGTQDPAEVSGTDSAPVDQPHIANPVQGKPGKRYLHSGTVAPDPKAGHAVSIPEKGADYSAELSAAATANDSPAGLSSRRPSTKRLPERTDYEAKEEAHAAAAAKYDGDVAVSDSDASTAKCMELENETRGDLRRQWLP